MDTKTKILVVEDDMIIAANITLQLTKLGYEITGIESRGEEAVIHAKINTPDIVLMDINLKGKLDGIETALAIQEHMDLPIVYLTANTDEASFIRAKKTRPYAFIPKPLNPIQFRRTLALLVEQIKERATKIEESDVPIEVLNDRIFVRHNGKLVKLLLEDILYIEADRNYSKIVTSDGVFLITNTLKTIENELKNSSFLRVHRSYMVNISKLDVLADKHLEINRKVIPLGRSHKELLYSRLQTI